MKTYLIVGGSKGIGLAIVDQLLDQGHQVVVISRTSEQLFVRNGISWIKKDITTDIILAEDLPHTLDGIVYCPGSIVLKPFRSLSEEQYVEDFAINCLGAIKVIKAGLNALKNSNNHPNILLFSTVAVHQGMPFHASIAAAKGAVEGLTKSLAAEFAPTIRVNCIAPSLTNTELASKLLSSPEKIQAAEQKHPMKAIGQAVDLASFALTLLSESSKWITGQIFHIDGGMSSVRP